MSDEEGWRCGDCRHWGMREDAGQQFRTCRCIKHDSMNMTNQEFDEIGDELEEIAARTAYRRSHKAVVQDEGGDRATLRCREDFGCVLFQPKR